MEIARWIVSIVALVLFGLLMFALFGMAVERIRTGRHASGLVFVPSIIAAIGILLMPVSTFSTRVTWVLIPFVIESSYPLFNVAYDFLLDRMNK